MSQIIRDKIIELAKSKVGYVEKEGNNTEFGVWFGFNRVPWCAIFVSWCYWFAGFKIKGMGFSKGFAGCQTAYVYFKKNNMLTDDPQKGDIVLFDWDGNGSWDHAAVFEAWKIRGSSFETVEGNTSFHNQSHGGQVMERDRTYIEGRVAFARVLK